MDYSLHTRIRAGDPEAFRELFRDHARLVHRHAVRVTGDWTVAEDIVSRVSASRSWLADTGAVFIARRRRTAGRSRRRAAQRYEGRGPLAVSWAACSYSEPLGERPLLAPRVSSRPSRHDADLHKERNTPAFTSALPRSGSTTH